MAMRSCTPLTLAESTIASCGWPSSSARAALCRQDSTTAARIMSLALRGVGEALFSSIIRVSRSESRLPQLTPMRTGFACRTAISIISANCGSRLLPRPTLPGLMRYLASASAQPGWAFSSLWPLKWKSPINGTSQPSCARRSRMTGTAAAASSLLTVIRTSSEPARARARTCCAVPSASAVSVLVIDCTTIGASPPIRTAPTRAATLFLRCLMS